MMARSRLRMLLVLILTSDDGILCGSCVDTCRKHAIQFSFERRSSADEPMSSRALHLKNIAYGAIFEAAQAPDWLQAMNIDATLLVE